MKSVSADKIISVMGLLAAFGILVVGIVWAVHRGANDFRVFYHAWGLVRTGRGADIYSDSPDRFLYAPGFAWLLSPLSGLPFFTALSLWCGLKAGVTSWVLFECARWLERSTPESGKDPKWLSYAGIAAWSVVLLARPILVDFEYGQVNLLILGVSVAALFRYYAQPAPRLRGHSSPRWIYVFDFASWALLGIVAVTRLYPLPLFLVPLCSPPPSQSGSQAGNVYRRMASLFGAAFGASLILGIPWVTEGLHGLLALYPKWKIALIDRGLPLESHNQSFAAFLHHYLSGQPTEIFFEHRRPVLLGRLLFSPAQIDCLSAAWALAFMSWIVAMALRPLPSEGISPFRRAAILIGLLVVPSHLVWKPYFLLGLPAAVLVLHRALSSRSAVRWAGVGLIFITLNFTGFDFVGPNWGAKFESGSLFLWAHLLLLMNV